MLSVICYVPLNLLREDFMAKVTKAVRHLSEEEILSRMKRKVGFWRVQKWLAILIATVDPCPAQKIAKHTGLAEQTIHNLISS